MDHNTLSTESPPPELVDHVRMALITGLGPRIRQALLECFDNPAEVFAAAPSDLRQVSGVGPKLVERILAARDSTAVNEELALCRRESIWVTTRDDDAYPRGLTEIHDPPGVLFGRGQLRPDDALAIGIVGSRHATQYGKRQARRLAASLSRAGLTVISGLARGIDAAAHQGALEAGGRTIAVLGGGLLRLYPPEHKELAHDVSESGAVISESPPRMAPMSGSFPQRNRIISGMSLGVVVVEAAPRSGALITARHAMEQGREVFAVPGPIDSRLSQGCHQLLRDGAKLVESADDVLEELGPLVAPTLRDDGTVVHHPAELQLNEIEQQLLQAISPSGSSIDEVAQATTIPVHRVLATISVLEMRRLIRRTSGNRVVRV